MPRHHITIALLAALYGMAQPALALTKARPDSVCDLAARRAAQSEGVPLNVLRAIARVETGRTRNNRLEPWPWTINLEGKGYWFASEAEAKSYVFDIFKSGARSFDIGCFQINYRWHGKAFRSIDAMFDPDENATYAARFLKQLHAELGSWDRAAGAYHSRTPALATAYATRFQTVLAGLEPDAPVQLAAKGRDPFIGAAAPLISHQAGGAGARPGALGSLLPAAGDVRAFIAFN